MNNRPMQPMMPINNFNAQMMNPMANKNGMGMSTNQMAYMMNNQTKMGFGQDMSKMQKFSGSPHQQPNMQMQGGGMPYMMNMSNMYPSMNNMGNMPNMPTMPSMPNMPNMNNMQGMASMNRMQPNMQNYNQIPR